MLEFSLAVPVVLLFVAGVVDVGLSLRREQVIYAAAKHAARIGSGERGRNDTGIPAPICHLSGPGAPANSALLSECGSPTLPKPSDPSSTFPTPVTVDMRAKGAACDYLESAGLTPGDWSIEPEVPSAAAGDPPIESQLSLSFPGGVPRQLLKVTIKNKAPVCYVCLLGKQSISATSTFAMEMRCD